MTHARNFSYFTIVGLAALATASVALAAGESPEDALRRQTFDNLRTAARYSWALAGGEERKAAMAAEATTPVEFSCFPSCDENDGRFLSIAGSNLITLSDTVLEVEMAVPAGTSSFRIGIFDGDGSEPTPAGPPDFGVTRWDLGVPAPFTYTLFADPTGDGSGTTVVPLQSGFPSVSSTAMPNDEWCCSDISTGAPGDFVVNTSAAAQAPSGNYFYRLRIELLTPSVTTMNNFKIRTSGVVTIEPFAQPFSYIANLNSASDIFDVFPTLLPDLSNLPTAVSTTTYDGDFSFFFEVDRVLTDLTVWDGDFDRGKFDGSDRDTDDLDTPNAPFLPAFALGTDALPEGVAGGLLGSTGAPSDDIDPSSGGGFGLLLLRAPSIRYDLLAPDGQDFANPNPSGNREWERFTLSTAPFDPTAMDHSVPSIPLGAYEMRIQGVDMQNLNAVVLPFRALCVNSAGAPCEPLRPFVVGDTTFADFDGDGVQGGGDAGLAGILVNLLDGSGRLLRSTVTDADGKYRFEVEAGTYTVEVAPENFNAPLLRGALGDRVWLDEDGDGVEDAGEPGIANVKVRLFEAGLNGLPGGGDDLFLGARITGLDGRYLFTGLAPGVYFTVVDPATVPAGLGLSGGTSPSAVRAVLDAETFFDLDFGYGNSSAATAIVGDFVWSDADGDGVHDSGEPGIGGVTLELTDVSGAVVLATATTAPDGSYLFTGVAPGPYRVRVTDVAGVLAGYSLTGGSDPTGVIGLSPGEVFLGADFGYRNPALHSLSEVVFFDADRSGTLDGGEPGISGVTVNLLGLAGKVIATSDAGGGFSFSGLPDGAYTLVVTDVGHALAGLVPTTRAAAAGTLSVLVNGASFGGESFGYLDGGALEGRLETTPTTFTKTVTDDNVLTYDFGFEGSKIGDRVWLDFDNDGVQDAAEPGLNGVPVELLDAGGAVIATALTAGDGEYLFDRLPGGTYSVRVDIDAFSGGLLQTYDLDDGTGPFASPQKATVTVAGFQDNFEVDFGYDFDPAAEALGCTPGYWKQRHHFDSWVKYRPRDRFDPTFGVASRRNRTLVLALNDGGGDDDALNRHGTAALLNATNSGVGYLYAEALVIAAVQYAYASGDFEAVKNVFERQNEQGCRLN